MQVVETTVFSGWLGGLRDTVGRRAVVRRLTRLAATGNFGDHASVGERVFEMRLHLGPGYRLYYTIKDGAVILCGGDKGSQSRDIERAERMVAELYIGDEA